MTIPDQVMRKLLDLPEERQREVLAFVEELARHGDTPPQRIATCGILRDHLSEMSLEDFRKLRAEIYGNRPHDCAPEG